MAHGEGRYHHSLRRLEEILAQPHHVRNRLKTLDELAADLATASKEEKYRLSVSRRCACVLHDAQRVGKCPFCWISLPRCLCATIPRLDIAHRFYLLLHFKEYHCISNTGRILMMALDGEVLIPGLEEHDDHLAALCEDPNTCILFPSPTATSIRAFFDRRSRDLPGHPHVADEDAPERDDPVRNLFEALPLVVPEPCSATPKRPPSPDPALLSSPTPSLNILIPDGTWNLVHGVLRRVPHHVPCIAVQPPRGYATIFNSLRKQPSEGHVSTMEAGLLLLQEMGLDSDSSNHLMGPLKHHVDVVRLCARQEQVYGTVPTARLRQSMLASDGPHGEQTPPGDTDPSRSGPQPSCAQGTP